MRPAGDGSDTRMITHKARMDEKRRLEALRQYHILDTPAEDALDDLAALAATICHTPFALISLVDEDRQWFKSRVGFSVAETPLNVSFCAHALHQSELLIIPDTTQDERFARNPLVTGSPGIRFYAGAPLVTPDGAVLGTLCVADLIPRTLASDQTGALRVLGRQVMTHLELRRHERKLLEEVAVVKVAKEAVGASELRYRRLFETAKDGILILNAETGMVVDVNPFLITLLGFSHAQFLEKAIWQLGFFKDVAANEQKFAELRESGYARYESLPLETAGGRRIEVEFVSNVYLVNDTKVIQCNVRDVTERKQSEKRLKESERRFRRLVESNAQGVLFWNTAGQITGANDAFLKLVGYSRQEMEAGLVNWIAITPPEYAKLDQLALEEIAIKGACVPYEKEYIRKDGTHVPILLGAASFEDNPQEGVCFAVDLTERKRLERHALRTQRMESIGTLAGGIAHDLNNSLGPIIMALDLLKMKFPDPSSQELIAMIGASAQRGADMVRQVLSFGRGVEGRKMEVQIRHLIQEIEKIANDTFLKNILVRTIIPGGLWTVIGDPTQLHQVLLNLCVNARDAMPSGGTLTISAKNFIVDAHYAALNLEAKAGPYVVLQVKDTGTGMTPEVIENVFDPFFTTKEVGQGTGIGLSTSLAIVKSHNGFIRVCSEPRNGASFTVYLPAHIEASVIVVAEKATEMPRGNGELILIVDDEASFREITRITLEAFGYRVVLAADGPAAAGIFVQHRAEIAAVLTDMTMPTMDGPTLIGILRALNPSVRILAVSGLSSKDQVERAMQLGAKDFLPKPYTAETLLKALRGILTIPA